MTPGEIARVESLRAAWEAVLPRRGAGGQMWTMLDSAAWTWTATPTMKRWTATRTTP